MVHTYQIKGMTCNSCVAKVKSELLKLGDVVSADVQLQHPQATITMQQHIAVEKLQQAIAKAGNYQIAMDTNSSHHETEDTEEVKSWVLTYKPLLLIAAYIIALSFITSLKDGMFDWKLGMNHFMAAFFLVFSFFKMLNLRGFADSYSSYDVLAKHWYNYGFVYPFIELLLGIAYLLQWQPVVTNITTIVVMGFSTIGVLQSLLNKRKIQCACLGAVFNLPMSTITVIEDLLMVSMAVMVLQVH